MKEGRDLVKEAVEDAKSLREAALQAAKNEIIEGLAPGIRNLLEQSIKGALGATKKNEDTDRLRRGIEDNAPGESHTGFEESKDRGEDKMDDMKKKVGAAEPELDLESLAGFFPQLAEMPAEEDPALEAAAGASGIPVLGEDEEAEEAPEHADAEADAAMMKKEAKDEAGKEKEKMEEEIEISEAELRKVYEAALQTEVQVKKGFSDLVGGGELEDAAKETGIADTKKGESNWEKVEPPAKEDFTVKEMIQRGLAENKALRGQNAKLMEMVKTLAGKLHETNLFNSKVLHVNRILNQGRLTKEQKEVVLESIDKARSVEEVKVVYETIVNSFKAAQSLHEGKNPRKPAANAQRPRSSGAPDQKVLSESVDRSNSNPTFERFAMLAGLRKVTK